MERYTMSESSRRVLNSCLTIAVVITLILCVLFIVGAGVLIFGATANGL
jgi:succinate dehydrogenase hydrophobic anchor subunit